MRRCRIVHRHGVLVLAVVILAAVPTATRAAQPGNWSKLIEGPEMSAWRQPTGDWKVVGDVFLNPTTASLLAWTSGTGVIVNGAKGRTNNILSKMEHGDVEAHVEFMVPKGSNSGVYFMGRYEIQVFDSFGVKEAKYSDCGGIYERWKNNKGYEGHAPRVNASRKPGEWQTFDVVFRAPRFDAAGKKTANAVFVKVVHNGTVIHENVEVTGPTRAATYEDEKPLGPLMLQGDHGPVAYANIRLRPIPPNYGTKPAAGTVGDETYKRLAGYQFGDDREDLIAVEEASRNATPEQRDVMETRLIEILKSPDATPDGRQFVCRMLRQMGTAKSVPALAALLTDEKLSHMARYALQGMAGPEIDEALRVALGKVDGKLKIGVIGSIGARRDQKAVPQLARLVADKDVGVAQAAILALGHIGGSEATKVLTDAKVPETLEAARADALLMCSSRRSLAP